MTDCRNWYGGWKPDTPGEWAQDRAEQLMAQEDRADMESRFVPDTTERTDDDEKTRQPGPGQ